MQRALWSILVGVMVLGLSATAWADDGDFVEPSEGQLDLNDRGVESIAEGNYDAAVRLFEASLDLGKLNVTHTNLGRAYQHAGECEKAEKQFEKALQAPAATEPTPEQIRLAIDAYRAEMEETCPGHLKLECSPQQMAVTIDGEGPQECDAEARRALMPGRYDVVGEFEGHEVSERVMIRALEEQTVQLDLSHVEIEKEEEIVEDDPDDPDEQVAEDEAPGGDEVAEIQEPPPPERTSTTSWLMLTASSLTLAGGVALDTIPESSRNGVVDPINFVPVGLYAASIGLAWYGIRKLRQ